MIEERSIPEPNSGCWLWLGSVNSWGYGMMRVNRKVCCAHVASWRFYRGSIPEGYEVDHKCRVRSCVNPDHLEPVTHKENVRRGNSPWGGVLAKKTHCLRGHEYTPANTLTSRHTYNGSTMRQCRICKNEAQKLKYRKRKA
jgi:HNH endonuclease